MNKCAITLIFNCFLISLSSQVQIGDAINGAAAGDHLGYSVSLSSNGKRVAIGSKALTENPWNLQIYEEHNDFWTQVGSVIEIEAEYDDLTPSTDLSSDGNRVAIGIPMNGGSEDHAGHVRIYEEISGVWSQLGSDIDGEAAGDLSGISIALSSDGTRVAIGAPGNSDNGAYTGHVRIYEENNGVWTQIGTDIDGLDTEGGFGTSVSLSSDGTRVAIGVPNGEPFGYVRIYEESNGTWIPISLGIEGEDPNYRVGYLLVLSSDGSRVAFSEAENGSGLVAHIKIYEENNGVWTQVGMDIEGGQVYVWAGTYFSLSGDGSRVALGDAGYFEPIEQGYVRIYDEHNGTWTQIGMNIEGENIGDYFGFSVSLSSDKTRLAIGAPNSNSNGGFDGQVKIFELPINSSSVSDIKINSEIVLKVSPNPSDGIFFVEFNSDVETLIVSDANGKVIQTVPIKGTTHHTINLSGLPSGVYFLRAKSNHASKVQQLIKL